MAETFNIAELGKLPLDVGKPFSIPQDVLNNAPSIAQLRAIVQNLKSECELRGLTLSEWFDPATQEHMFKVDRREVLTISKLQGIRSMLLGEQKLSDSPT